MINRLAARRVVQRRKDLKASLITWKKWQTVPDTASKAAQQAVGKAEQLATQAEELKEPEVCASKTEADMAAESAEEEASKARGMQGNAESILCLSLALQVQETLHMSMQLSLRQTMRLQMQVCLVQRMLLWMHLPYPLISCCSTLRGQFYEV